MLELGSETLVITHDAMAEGTHFRSDADMADVAWKLVAANLSDLAAKGAEPVGALLGYTLGHDGARFLEGLREVLDAYHVGLLGGDTIAAQGARVLGLTMIGRATHTPVPSRSGAQVGDAIWHCGTLGAAMLGFEQQGGLHAPAFDRPVPLLADGKALAPIVTAMMDVSDGLLLDASRMATASGLTFDISTTGIDVADPSRVWECLSWGDDYALLFTCGPKVEIPVAASPVGTVIACGPHPILVDSVAPAPKDRLGYQHG